MDRMKNKMKQIKIFLDGIMHVGDVITARIPWPYRRP